MTSPRSPVGALVIVLAGLVALGCSTQTGAMFQTLLAPAVAASPGSGEVSAWWAHPEDGYAMVLPPGWAGVPVDAAFEDELLGAIADSHPAIAERMQLVLEGTSSRVSAIAVDTSSSVDPPPLILVLAQPTEGRKARAVKLRVEDQISALPGIVGVPSRRDVHLTAASGVSFDYLLADPELGELRVTSYLIRFGSQAYIVTFVAAQDAFDESESVFQEIAQSLRVGV